MHNIVSKDQTLSKQKYENGGPAKQNRVFFYKHKIYGRGATLHFYTSNTFFYIVTLGS